MSVAEAIGPIEVDTLCCPRGVDFPVPIVDPQQQENQSVTSVPAVCKEFALLTFAHQVSEIAKRAAALICVPVSRFVVWSLFGSP